MNRGVIYLAIGKSRFIQECIFSARSLKEHCPTLHVTVFTDPSGLSEVQESAQYFDEIVTIGSHNPYPMLTKVECLNQTPYEETLYLDGDTLIVKPIYEMFDWLLDYDLCIGNGPRWSRTKPHRLLDYAAEGNHNAGVIVYRKSKPIEQFMSHWLSFMQGEVKGGSDHYENLSANDQHFLNLLIKQGYHEECGIQFKIFPNTIYNARAIMLEKLKQEDKLKYVKIFHIHDLHEKPVPYL